MSSVITHAICSRCRFALDIFPAPASCKRADLHFHIRCERCSPDNVDGVCVITKEEFDERRKAEKG